MTSVSSVDWKVVALVAAVNVGVDLLAEVNVFKVVECFVGVVVGSVNFLVVLVVASVFCCIVWVT